MDCDTARAVLDGQFVRDEPAAASGSGSYGCRPARTIGTVIGSSEIFGGWVLAALTDPAAAIELSYSPH
ncbi:hypothetical protein [Nocardia xishanensis]